MRRSRKKYETPKRPWDRERIEKEKELMKKYGLRRKREIWKSEAILRKYRRIARDLAAKKDEKMEKMLFSKLQKLGLLGKNPTLDDVLALTVEDILERRLQTVIWRKGLANTPKHARQLIVHGHVKLKGRKFVYPSYLVPVEEENDIEVEK